jgi:hypothetical protein
MLRKMEHFASLSPISPVDPIPWASPRRGGEATVKKKRALDYYQQGSRDSLPPPEGFESSRRLALLGSSWANQRPQALEPLDVVLLVEGQADLAVVLEGDTVLRQRQVLAAQPEVDRVVGQHLEGHLG